MYERAKSFHRRRMLAAADQKKAEELVSSLAGLHRTVAEDMKYVNEKWIEDLVRDVKVWIRLEEEYIQEEDRRRGYVTLSLTTPNSSDDREGARGGFERRVKVIDEKEWMRFLFKRYTKFER